MTRLWISILLLGGGWLSPRSDLVTTTPAVERSSDLYSVAIASKHVELPLLVTTERVGVKTVLQAMVTPAPPSTAQYSWVVGGQRIKTYWHDIDDPTRHLPVPLTASDLKFQAVSFFWTAEANPVTVSVVVTIDGVAYSESIDFDVRHDPDANYAIYTRDGQADRAPNGPSGTYSLLQSHFAWHLGGLMTNGEPPLGSSIGGNWGERDASGVLFGPGFNGVSFLNWHRSLLSAHGAWRSTFNIGGPDLATPVFGVPPMPEYLKAIPEYSSDLAQTRSQHLGYVRLGEFQNENELGRAVADPWHSYSHFLLSFYGYSFMAYQNYAPRTLNSVFWRYHTLLDTVRANYQPDQAAVLTTIPVANATVPAPTQITVAFDRKVSANAPSGNLVQLLASALTVNGSPATNVVDAGPTELRYQIYSFTGFAPPSPGVVTITLSGTASYAGSTWRIKVP